MWGQRGTFHWQPAGEKIQQKDFNTLDIRLSDPDYKITIFTMIKEINEKVAMSSEELGIIFKCGIAEVKRSQIAVVHLKTVNKKVQ